MSGAPPDLGSLLRAQEDRLMNCVHCGFCLPACPTYNRLGEEADSPRGRLYLMRAVVDGRLETASDAFQTHIDRCLGCRACEPVCPSGVEYGLLLEAARAEAADARRPPLLARMLLRVMERPGLLRAWGFLSRSLRATGLPALGARFLPSRGWWGSIRLGLAMLAASAPPRDRLRRRRSGRGQRERTEADGGVSDGEGPPAVAPEAPERWSPVGGRETRSGGREREPGSTVVLLNGCVQSVLFRRVNQATREVLEANGFVTRSVPGQGCCGALHAHAGEIERARALARGNVRAFRDAGVDRIVVNAAGCGAAMKEYGHLLVGDPEWARDARRTAAAIRDISEVLVEGPGSVDGTPGPRPGAAVPIRVAYDPPCHLLHGQGVADPPLLLLRAVPGLELHPVENAEECCGGAGIYGLTHPELGGRITSEKVAAVEASGADTLATGNPGCMMQIGAGLRISGSRITVRHPVEILAESYRREQP